MRGWKSEEGRDRWIDVFMIPKRFNAIRFATFDMMGQLACMMSVCRK